MVFGVRLQVALRKIQILKMSILHKVKLTKNIILYNLKIVFGNRFIYFAIAALAFYLIVTGIMLFSDANPEEEDIYATLILPGMLILFYPVIFNIQNDKDARMLEIVFGIPNYRYKIYFVRFVISLGVLVVFLLFMSWFSHFAVVPHHIFTMVYRLMFPLVFFACLAFLFATLLKNGRGAAVVLVIIGLIFFILSGAIRHSKWNVFLNPYNIPNDISYGIWLGIVFQNRLILLVASAVSLLWSMTNLQKREKFV